MLFAYGRSKISLACATRIVCSVNASPVPSTTVREPVNLKAMFIVVKLETLNTSYTPSTSVSKNRIIILSPAVRSWLAVKITRLVPSRLSHTCAIVPGTASARYMFQS